eukprot:m.28356 g.28356  ORF g.28356 m.28356 type:complete len:2443 (+) comp9037_c0_seq1:3-7331(+)
MIDPHLRTFVVAAALLECGGDVVHFAGDAVLCFWPCTRAETSQLLPPIVKACKHVQRCFHQANLAAPTRAPIGIKLAIATGRVDIWHLRADDGTCQYMAVGDALKLAAKCQDVAKSGDILVSPECLSTLLHCEDLVPMSMSAKQPASAPIQHSTPSSSPTPASQTRRGSSLGKRLQRHSSGHVARRKVSCTSSSSLLATVDTMTPALISYANVPSAESTHLLKAHQSTAAQQQSLRFHSTGRTPAYPLLSTIPYIPRTAQLKAQGSTNSQWTAELRVVTTVFVQLWCPPDDSLDALLFVQQSFAIVAVVAKMFGGEVVKTLAFDKNETAMVLFGLPGQKQEHRARRSVYAAVEIYRRLSAQLQEYMSTRFTVSAPVTSSAIPSHTTTTTGAPQSQSSSPTTSSCSTARCSHSSDHAAELKPRAVGVGVATGAVFCGIVGHKDRCEYAVIGDSVNMAARLMSLSMKNQRHQHEARQQGGASQDRLEGQPRSIKPVIRDTSEFGVAVDELTAGQSTVEAFSIHSNVAIKGKLASQTVYFAKVEDVARQVLTGNALELASPPAVTANDAAHGILGQSHVVSRFVDCLVGAQMGHRGTVYHIEGGVGMGKSHTMLTLHTLCKTRKVPSVLVACTEVDQHDAFAAARKLLLSYLYNMTNSTTSSTVATTPVSSSASLPSSATSTPSAATCDTQQSSLSPSSSSSTSASTKGIHNHSDITATIQHRLYDLLLTVGKHINSTAAYVTLARFLELPSCAPPPPPRMNQTTQPSSARAQGRRDHTARAAPKQAGVDSGLGLVASASGVSVCSDRVPSVRSCPPLRSLLLDVLSNVCADVVVCIDNIQFCDASSWQVLSHLLESKTCLVLATTARPFTPTGYARRYLTSDSSIRQVLSPLNDVQMCQLACMHLQVDFLPGELKKLLCKRGQGVPLFCEQLVASLKDHGLLKTVTVPSRFAEAATNQKLSRTSYAVSLPDHGIPYQASTRSVIDQVQICQVASATLLQTVPMPETLNDVLLHRFDELSPETLLMLKCAAIVGMEFTLEDLQLFANITGISQATVKHLKDLVQHGLVELVDGYTTGQPHARFLQASIQHVAYHLWPPSMQRMLHAQFALGLEVRVSLAIARHVASAKQMSTGPHSDTDHRSPASSAVSGALSRLSSSTSTGSGAHKQTASRLPESPSSTLGKAGGRRAAHLVGVAPQVLQKPEHPLNEPAHMCNRTDTGEGWIGGHGLNMLESEALVSLTKHLGSTANQLVHQWRLADDVQRVVLLSIVCAQQELAKGEGTSAAHHLRHALDVSSQPEFTKGQFVHCTSQSPAQAAPTPLRRRSTTEGAPSPSAQSSRSSEEVARQSVLSPSMQPQLDRVRQQSNTLAQEAMPTVSAQELPYLQAYIYVLLSEAYLLEPHAEKALEASMNALSLLRPFEPILRSKTRWSLFQLNWFGRLVPGLSRTLTVLRDRVVRNEMAPHAARVAEPSHKAGKESKAIGSTLGGAERPGEDCDTTSGNSTLHKGSADPLPLFSASASTGSNGSLATSTRGKLRLSLGRIEEEDGSAMSGGIVASVAANSTPTALTSQKRLSISSMRRNRVHPSATAHCEQVSPPPPPLPPTPKLTLAQLTTAQDESEASTNTDGMSRVEPTVPSPTTEATSSTPVAEHPYIPGSGAMLQTSGSQPTQMGSSHRVAVQHRGSLSKDVALDTHLVAPPTTGTTPAPSSIQRSTATTLRYFLPSSSSSSSSPSSTSSLNPTSERPFVRQRFGAPPRYDAPNVQCTLKSTNLLQAVANQFQDFAFREAVVALVLSSFTESYRCLQKTSRHVACDNPEAGLGETLGNAGLMKAREQDEMAVEVMVSSHRMLGRLSKRKRPPCICDVAQAAQLTLSLTQLCVLHGYKRGLRWSLSLSRSILDFLSNNVYKLCTRVKCESHLTQQMHAAHRMMLAPKGTYEHHQPSHAACTWGRINRQTLPDSVIKCKCTVNYLCCERQVDRYHAVVEQLRGDFLGFLVFRGHLSEAKCIAQRVAIGLVSQCSQLGAGPELPCDTVAQTCSGSMPQHGIAINGLQPSSNTEPQCVHTQQQHSTFDDMSDMDTLFWGGLSALHQCDLYSLEFFLACMRLDCRANGDTLSGMLSPQNVQPFQYTALSMLYQLWWERDIVEQSKLPDSGAHGVSNLDEAKAQANDGKCPAHIARLLQACCCLWVACDGETEAYFHHRLQVAQSHQMAELAESNCWMLLTDMVLARADVAFQRVGLTQKRSASQPQDGVHRQQRHSGSIRIVSAANVKMLAGVMQAERETKRRLGKTQALFPLIQAQNTVLLAITRSNVAMESTSSSSKVFKRAMTQAKRSGSTLLALCCSVASPTLSPSTKRYNTMLDMASKCAAEQHKLRREQGHVLAKEKLSVVLLKRGSVIKVVSDASDDDPEQLQLRLCSSSSEVQAIFTLGASSFYEGLKLPSWISC